MHLIQILTFSLIEGMRRSWKHSRHSLLNITVTSLSLILWSGGFVHAAEYHVDVNGTNTNPGTESQPWSTVDFAIGNAAPGDTIFVRGGVYNERVTITVSGTPGNYITLQNYPGEQPILDGSGLGNGEMFNIIHVSYFKLIGFEIKDHTGGGVGVYGDGTHIEIRDNWIHDQTHLSGFGHAIFITAIDPALWGTAEAFDVILSDIVVDGNTVGPNVSTGSPSAYNEAVTFAWNVKRWQLTNNVINDVSHIGSSIIGKADPFGFGFGPAWPQYGYIAGNTYSNVGYTGGSPFPNSAIHMDGAQDIVIEDNLFFDGRDYGIDMISEPGGVDVERIIVRRNSILRQEKRALHAMGFTLPANNVRHAHNSIYADTSNAFGIALDTGNDVSIKNNIIYVQADDGYAIFHDHGTESTSTLDYNLYTPSNALYQYKGTFYTTFSDYQSATGQDANSFVGDPLYTNPAANDLTLLPGSPAINAGTLLTTAVGSGSNSTTLVVGDSRWFHDGMGIEGLAGDTIRVGASTAVITNVDYSTDTITLAAPISWSNGDGVSYPYAGAAPDLGAHDTGGVAQVPAAIPNPPNSFTSIN